MYTDGNGGLFRQGLYTLKRGSASGEREVWSPLHGPSSGVHGLWLQLSGSHIDSSSHGDLRERGLRLPQHRSATVT